MSEPRKKTGLFFGSFNPVHIGHLIIGQYFTQFSDLDEVWFVVSPHNPLKEKSSLLEGHLRLYMVNLALEDDPLLRATNIEFTMPQPSYTIDTLTWLSEKYPQKQFVLIGGTDIFPTFHKWKNHQEILSQYDLYIYNRPGYDAGEYASYPRIRFFSAPLMEISASFIREAIRQGKDVSYMLPSKVWAHIVDMGFYK
ncbi:MAG: nicotinate-nucleotide adenylyltransferase [Bacteroidetes bacterium]|nr:nicotinate-nucleotide adenylyltransferase [Bacteroidota bacterium]